jgi:hypothetical protein
MQHKLQHGHTTMTLQLKNIFASVGMGGREEEREESGCSEEAGGTQRRPNEASHRAPPTDESTAGHVPNYSPRPGKLAARL